MLIEFIGVILTLILFGVAIFWLIDFFRQKNRNLARKTDPSSKPKLKKRTPKRKKPQSQRVVYRDIPKEHEGHCVYQITVDDLVYVGVSCNFNARMQQHLMDLNGSCHCNYKLQALFDQRKITKRNFSIYQSGLTPDAAYQLEYELRPRKNMGLNIIAGGK